jgi:hypothetical protein
MVLRMLTGSMFANGPALYVRSRHNGAHGRYHCRTSNAGRKEGEEFECLHELCVLDAAYCDLAGLLFDAVRRCSGVMWAGLTVVACAIEPRRFLGACDDVGELFPASCFVLFGVVRLFSL